MKWTVCITNDIFEVIAAERCLAHHSKHSEIIIREISLLSVELDKHVVGEGTKASSKFQVVLSKSVSYSYRT